MGLGVDEWYKYEVWHLCHRFALPDDKLTLETSQRTGLYGGSVIFGAPVFGLCWSDVRNIFERLDEDFVDIFWSRMAAANQIPLCLPRRLYDV